jgi:hypothetical protein
MKAGPSGGDALPPAEPARRRIVTFFLGCLLIVIGTLVVAGVGLCSYLVAGQDVEKNWFFMAVVDAIPLLFGLVTIWCGTHLCRRPYRPPESEQKRTNDDPPTGAE